ncbi:thioesterase-like superfamily-domain-containing protein [Phellopilus nigrolimitatus]|nr:thioesterase-like superfamily-domain-containing protein [Phellopilus nigrolimitatus]
MSLRAALKTRLSSNSPIQTDAVYKAEISEAWCIGGIPQGGYAVGIILSGAADLQASTRHPDIIHVTAHFLQSPKVGECEVRVKRIRQGRKLSNLEADLIQNGKTKISTRLVFGVLPDMTLAVPSDSLTLAPPSPLVRLIPLTRHPSLMTPDKPNARFLYQIKAEDRSFKEQISARARRHPAIDSDQSQTNELEWGAWIQLADRTDAPLEPEMIPFFADCVKNLPALLPRELRPGPRHVAVADLWFATVVLTVEFKSKIPSFKHKPDLKSSFSPSTIGIYSSARFMSEGRHDEYTEIWTAPSDIGSAERDGRTESEVDSVWRNKQVCLAISSQMALTIPESMSRRKAYGDGSRL